MGSGPHLFSALLFLSPFRPFPSSSSPGAGGAFCDLAVVVGGGTAACDSGGAFSAVCPVSGTVFEAAPREGDDGDGKGGGNGDNGGGGGGNDDEEEGGGPYGGRLGRAFAEGYLGE